MTDWSPTSPLDDRPPLYRSSERKVAGIAGGIAEHFSVNANIVRALFGVFALAGGAGFLLYLGLWVLVPLPPHLSGKTAPERSTRSLILGGGLLGIAVILGLIAIGGFDILRFIMLGLFFVGIALLNRRAGGTVAAAAPMPFPPPTETAPTPPIDDVFTPSPLTEELQDPIGDLDFPPPEVDESEGTDLDLTTELDIPSETPDPTTQMPVSLDEQFGQPDPVELPLVAPNPVPPHPPDPLPSPPQHDAIGPPADPGVQRSHWAVTKTAEETSLTAGKQDQETTPLASITLAAILAVVGVALVLNTLADIFVGAVTVSGISLAFVGTAIAVTSYRGSTFPLVPIALASLFALFVSPTVDHAIQDGVGSKELDIDSVANLDPAYVHGVGGIELDLTDLELTEDVTLNIEVGTGYIEVLVPRGMAVEVNAETEFGYVSVFDNSRAGFGSGLRLRPSASTDPDAPRLFLNAKTDIGSTDVYRR